MSGYELSRNQRPIHSDYRRSDDRVTLDSDLVTLDGRCRSKTQFLVSKSDPDFPVGRSVARTDGRSGRTHIDFWSPCEQQALAGNNYYENTIILS